MYDVFGARCAACGTAADIEIDHHRPLSDGHTLLHNAVPLCRSCNGRKGSQAPEDFYDGWKFAEIMMLLFESRSEFDREVYTGSTALILRSRGQLTGCSTPLGRRGIFWEIATEELRKYPHPIQTAASSRASTSAAPATAPSSLSSRTPAGGSPVGCGAPTTRSRSPSRGPICAGCWTRSRWRACPLTRAASA